MVSAAEKRAAMGNHQRSRCRGDWFFPGAEQPSPELSLGLHIQGAGQIVKDQQRRLPDKHAGRGGPLDLPAGETNTPRADHRIQPPLQSCDVGGEHGMIQGSSQIHLVFWQPQQDVVSERQAEQPRHLGRVRAAGRHKEGRRVIYERSIPEDLTPIPIQQSEQGMEQGGLPGADLPGHHRQGARLYPQVDGLHTSAGARMPASSVKRISL